MTEWVLEESTIFPRRFKRYQKNHPDETAAVLNNLDTYVRTLQAGVHPSRIKIGFIHREPQGVIAIDQKGMKGSPRQTRLYLVPEGEEHVVYLITIGDKNTQSRDLTDCRHFIASLRKED